MNEFFPASETEAADLVRQHAETGTPVAIRGGGTKAGWGKATEAASTLCTAALSGIVAYNPNEMVMTVRAGTPVAEVEAALEAAGQMMAFEPADYRGLMGTSGEPTIGGVFAANVSGPRRLVAGAARDSLLGVRFVNGRGEIVKNGGRVMKNVTGLDLVKLLAGSFGTLGLLTEVTFRVPPRPKSEQSIVLSGLDDAQAAKVMAKVMALPVEVSGAAHLPASIARKLADGGLPEGGATVLRVEGLPGSVAIRGEKLGDAMSAFGAVARIEQDASRSLWREVRDVRAFADGTTRPVWRISVAPSDGHRVVDAFRTEGVDAFYDWQGGLVWMRMRQEPEANRLRQVIKTLGGGHATLIRANEAARMSAAVFQPEGDAIAALSARVKKAFDPAGIFNPGVMAGY